MDYPAGYPASGKKQIRPNSVIWFMYSYQNQNKLISMSVESSFKNLFLKFGQYFTWACKDLIYLRLFHEIHLVETQKYIDIKFSVLIHDNNEFRKILFSNEPSKLLSFYFVILFKPAWLNRNRYNNYRNIVIVIM